MRIRSAYSKTERCPVPMSSENSHLNSEKNADIIYKQYNVYAIEIWDGKATYYFYDADISCDYEFYYLDLPTFAPVGYPWDLFEIIDNRCSRHWGFTYHKCMNAILWAFPEWAHEWVCRNDDYEYINEGFYERLLNNNTKNLETFKMYKDLMDLEFPNDEITEISQVVGRENYAHPSFLCPCCQCIWVKENPLDEWSDLDAMVRCSLCQKVSHNPLYKEKTVRSFNRKDVHIHIESKKLSLVFD